MPDHPPGARLRPVVRGRGGGSPGAPVFGNVPRGGRFKYRSRVPMPCKSGRRRNAQVPTSGLARPDLSGRRTDLWRLGRRLDAEPAWKRAWIRPGSRGRRRSSLRGVGRVDGRAYPGYRSVALGACVGRTNRGTRPLSHVLRRTRSSPGVGRCATRRSHARACSRPTPSYLGDAATRASKPIKPQRTGPSGDALNKPDAPGTCLDSALWHPGRRFEPG